MQKRSATNVLGIDVSHHQGTIDWVKVAAAKKIGFVFIKASEGAGGNDSQFRRNAMGASAVGLAVGFYHYARPENNSPAVEVDNFLSTVNGIKCQLPYVLDLEGEAMANKVGGGKPTVARQKLTAWALEWMRLVKKKTGHDVMLYTGASFARSYCGAELREFPLWVAHYGTNDPMDNTTWKQWAVFQYTSTNEPLPGIRSAGLDRNVMELDFYEKYVEVKHKMEKNDAEALIKILQAAYTIDMREALGLKIDRNEIHRLANSVRRAAGLKEE